jgi:multidrug resistance efflux pump
LLSAFPRLAGWARLVCAVPLLGACSTAAPGVSSSGSISAPEVEVRRGDIDDVLLLSGEIESSSSENFVVPRTDTWVLTVRWLPKEGTHVEKGDRVVEFDNSAFVSRVQERTYTVETAESELLRERASGELAEAQKRFDLRRAEVNLEKARIDASVPKDTVSERSWAQRDLAVKQAESTVQKAKEELATQLESGTNDVKVRQVDLDNAKRELDVAKKALEALTLVTPIAGTVVIGNNWPDGGRKYRIGDTAHPGQVVASLPNLDHPRVRARLSDVDERTVTVGMAARSILDAFPDAVYPGVVDSVSPVARSLNRESEQQYFSVTVTLPEQDARKMHPGMSVRVEVVRRHAERVLLVSRRAINLSSGKATAHTRAGLVPLRIDWCNAVDCIATSGVSAGTRLLAVSGEESKP